MSKMTLQETFKSLQSLEVNYDIPDVSTEYLKVTNDIDIENYLDYACSHRNFIKEQCEKKCIDINERPGIFHVILSVKVNNDSSRFVPFFSIYSNSENGLVSQEERNKLFSLGQKEIQYDLSTFMSSFFRKFNEKYGKNHKDSEVSCCAFKVDTSNGSNENEVVIKELCFLSEFGQTNWIKSIDEKEEGVEKEEGTPSGNKEKEITTLSDLDSNGEDWFKRELFSEEKKSFVRSFSEYYKNKGASVLRYTIYNMDFDFGSNADCLTRLMIISTEAGEVSRFMMSQLNKIREIVSFIRSRYAFDLIGKNRYLAIKAAKAAIMSRNMSHNLGSHVMYFIRQQLSSPKQIVEGGLVLGDYSSDTIFQKYDEYNGIKQPQLPFLVGLSRFLGYLQERQDYIATMATDYIPAPTTINLKDAVYDELKPDLKYRRHKDDDTLYKNADTLSKPQNLLLDYIAFSEGYTSSDQIIIQFDDFDGTRGNGLDHLRKINIDIPGGIMGRQALFSIFENIIRNAAKHCYPRTKDGRRILSLKLNLLDDNDNLIKEEIYKNNAQDLHYLSIICNMPNKKGEANNLSEKLEERYINDDGTPNENYKGLKEIRLSAAWLRKYKLDTDIPSTLPPAVKVRATKLTPLPGETENDFGDQEAIEFIIALPKPKKIAFIHYNKDASDSKSHKGEGNNEGYIYLIVNSTDETFLKKTVVDNRLSRYDLIVTDNSSIVDNIGKYVPCRICTDDSLKNNPLKEELDGAIASSYYKRWLKRRFPTIPRLTILDNQAKVFHGERDDNTILIRDNANAPADCYDGTCVFTTHYAGRNNDDDYSKYLEKALFVESITGSNSTDRLLRHTPYSDIWLYKHIAASLTKVAVVDERIFSTMYGKHNESQQKQDSHKRNVIKTWVEKYNKNNQNWHTEFYNNYICLNIKNIEESLSISEKVSDIVREDNTEEEKISQIYQLIYGAEATTKEQDYSIIEQYQDKGICFFDIDIVKDQNNVINHIGILGYDRPVTETLGRLEKHEVNTIAKIEKNNGKFKINDTVAGFKEKFDFICIHQGILDKIYKAFDITNNEDKTAITDEFRTSFGRKDLGNVIIHSGRSIPSSMVMPQQVPFIPLSALDYAVRDCKYTLSELLYTVYSEERQ